MTGEEDFEVEAPTDERFWALVSLATSDWDRFGAELRELSTPQLAGFAAMFWELAGVFWEWAGNTIDAYDDAAQDIGGRLVARGREHFVRVIEDPTSLTAEVLESLEGLGMDIMYEATEIYSSRTGRHFPVESGDYFDLGDTEYEALLSDQLE